MTGPSAHIARQESASELPSPIGLARRIARRTLLTAQRIRPMWPPGFCLVTGAPRSGTSAIRAWLMAQDGVASFFETRALVAVHRFMAESSRFDDAFGPDEIVEQGRRLAWSYYGSRRVLIGKRLLVDKEPLEPIAFPAGDYAAFLSSVRRLFPEGKFLFMVRDPVSVVWSMRQRTWGKSLAISEQREFSIEQCVDIWNGVADVIAELADGPNVYVCSYDRLVSEPEAESRRLADFLGLGNVRPFVPRQPKAPGFSEEEVEMIRWQTGGGLPDSVPGSYKGAFNE